MRLIQHLLLNRFYKIVLYLLPLIFFSYLIYTFYYELNNQSRSIKTKPLVKKEKKIELFDFALDLEKYIKSKSAIIKNLKINPKNIALQIEGDLINSLKIIEFVENYNSKLSIKKLNFKVNSYHKIDLSLEIELNRVKKYYKNRQLAQITNNVLYGKTQQNIINNIKQSSIKIDAIINKEVLINNIWYKVGNLLNNQKIIDIKSDHITLEQRGVMKNIRMYENEYIR